MELEIFKTNDKKITAALISLFFVSIYLPLLFTNILSAALLLLAIIYRRKVEIREQIICSLFLLYFIYKVLNLFYTNNTSEGLFIIEKKLSFLFLPLSLVFIPKAKSILQKGLNSFYTISSIVAISLFVFFIYEVAVQTNISELINHGLSRKILFHSTYLSYLLGFSLLGISYQYLIQKNDLNKRTYLALAAITLHAIILLLLNARIILIGITLCWIFLFILAIVQKRKTFINLTVLLLLIGAGALLTIEPLNERLKEAINYNNAYNIEKVWGGRSMRLLKWECALNVYQEHPLLGVSAGDAQDMLQACYKDNNFSQLLYWENVKFNTHNQYLQELVSGGLIGISILLLLLLTLLFFAFRSHDVLSILFLTLTIILFITESALEANKGIVTFSFISTILLTQKKPA